MSANFRHITAGIGGAIATVAVIQMHLGLWLLIALTSLGAVLAAGVSFGNVSPRIAAASICGIAGVLVGLGCDDTSGVLGVVGALTGFAFCRTGLALLLGIVGALGGGIGLAVLEWTEYYASSRSSLLKAALPFLCVFGCPVIGLELGNYISH
jgi:hypothetical protein